MIELVKEIDIAHAITLLKNILTPWSCYNMLLQVNLYISCFQI